MGGVINGGSGNIKKLRDNIRTKVYRLHAVLIYSDVDENFIQFLQKSFLSLSTMAGEHVFLWWFENIIRDRTLLLRPGDDAADFSEHVTRSDSLLLARSLDIPMSKTPCVLLCRDLDDKSGVVYTFDNSWTHEHMGEHFKMIFDRLHEILSKYGKENLADIVGHIETSLTAIKTQKWVKRVTSVPSIGNVIKAISCGMKFLD